MDISQVKLQILWNKRIEIFADPQNGFIIDRFNRIATLFDTIKGLKLEERDRHFFLNNSEITLNDDKGNPVPPETLADYWVAVNTALSKNRNIEEGIYNMASRFGLQDKDIAKQINLPQLITDIGCMLGGFSFVEYEHRPDKLQMVSSFRLKSNAQTSGHDNLSLCTGGQYMWPSSHFADTNVFYRVIEAIQQITNNKFVPDQSQLVLHWPSAETRGEDTDDTTKQSFRKALTCRFPYKFFFSWTHDGVIPLFSLMVYKELCHQTNEELKYDDNEICQEYSQFVKNWAEYSQKIANMLPGHDASDKEFWLELGKLFAVISIQEQDIKNIRDLIETGNKAIILWGPPGTGKTYQAEALVRSMLAIKDDEKLEDYRYTPQMDNNKEDQYIPKGTGAYAIVQFHPNYTYEDFVGGISPILDGKNLAYTLKTGAFKSFCDMASKAENNNKKFIFIIDEINRADLSAVFGELLYALEYRGKPITIPHFSGPFMIPQNVFLIGTMNNVDKSLVTFDLALRRRFGFFKVMPTIKVIADILENAHINIDDESLSKYIARCNDLNNEIRNSQGSLGLGDDYQIGQAYFGKIKDFLKQDTPTPIVITSIELEKLWVYHLLPLMEEYLGGRLEDTAIQDAIKSMRDKFISGL